MDETTRAAWKKDLQEKCPTQSKTNIKQ